MRSRIALQPSYLAPVYVHAPAALMSAAVDSGYCAGTVDAACMYMYMCVVVGCLLLLFNCGCTTYCTEAQVVGGCWLLIVGYCYNNLGTEFSAQVPCLARRKILKHDFQVLN